MLRQTDKRNDDQAIFFVPHLLHINNQHEGINLTLHMYKLAALHFVPDNNRLNYYVMRRQHFVIKSRLKENYSFNQIVHFREGWRI